MSVTFPGRVEALINVPASVTISASNSGGGATSVAITEDSYFWTAAGSISGLAAHIKSQLDTLRAPSSGSWTVTLDVATGLFSIGCTGTTAIPSFSLAWTNTTLRDLLGFSRDIDYASTATEIAADLGYGSFSGGAGWLFNEASGDLAPVFGAVTLTPSGTAGTYGLTGPRGGVDKAITPTASDTYWTGGTVFDVGSNDDLIAVFVAKWTATPPSGATSCFGKIDNSVGGWAVWNDGSTEYQFECIESGQLGNHSTVSDFMTGRWHVGVAAIDRESGTARFGIRALDDGTVAVGNAVAVGSASFTTALSFRIGRSGWLNANVGLWHCAALCINTGPGVATGVPDNIATALTNYAATFSTWTATKQARGLWLPDCPIRFQRSYPKAAPKLSDLRSSQSPDGTLLSLVGNTWMEHATCSWDYVPLERAWEAETSTDNASWEYFYNETQLGLGSSWFTPTSAIQIYDSAGTLVGLNANSGTGTDGWQIRGLDRIDPQPSLQDWAQRWKVEIPALVSSG